MSIYEYNQEEHLRMEREQNFADGYENGFKEGIEKIARRMHGKGKTLEEIADLLGKEISEVEKILIHCDQSTKRENEEVTIE